MSRYLKSFVSVLVISLAVVAVSAQGASAVQFHSGSGSGKTELTGAQVSTFQFDLANGANVKCTTAVLEDWYEGTTTSLLVLNPKYSKCTGVGQTTTITSGECVFLITTPVSILGSSDLYTATSDLSCPKEQNIKIAVGDPVVSCTVTIAPQTLEGTVDLTNNTTAGLDDVLLKPTNSAAYSSTGLACGASGKGQFTGETTLRAFSDAVHSIWVDLAIF